MSDVNMANYAAAYVTASAVAPAGDMGGKLKCAFDKKVLSAALTDGDYLLGPKLPAGARVHEVILQTPAMGSGASFQVGHGATTDEAGSTVNADTDAFIPATDVSSAAIVKMSGAVNTTGLLKKFSSETQVKIYCADAGDATSGTILLGVYYTLD